MGYPWQHGETLTAADLNAAIANASIGGVASAGGDLSGSYPNPTVVKINGVAPSPSATMDTTNASNITSGTLAAARLPPTIVTPGTYLLSTITVDGTGRLTGASNGTQAWQAGVVTTLGTGLSLSSGTLSATGGSGSGIADAPSDSTYYARTNASWSHIPFSALTGSLAYSQLPTEVQQVPITFAFAGKPATGALANAPMAMALTIPANLAGSVVFDSTQATANATFTVNRITAAGVTTAIGTVTVTSTSHTSCTLAGTGASLAVGDTLQCVAPTQDATLADLGITVLASRV